MTFFLTACYSFSLYQSSLPSPGTSSLGRRIPFFSGVKKRMMSKNSHVSVIWPPSWNGMQLFWSNNFLNNSLVVFVWISRYKLSPKTSSLDGRIPSLQRVKKRMMSNIGHLSGIWPPSWNEVQRFWSHNFLCSSVVVFVWISRYKTVT